ncbi:MAG TPA: hypothetical protein VGM94_00650 [Galbitalea sp.]|jgi:hypothetical protein
MARGRLKKRFGKRRYTDNPAPRRSNPPLLADLVEFIAPGFAGFAATRFLTRIAAVQVEKWKPSWGKHAGAVASLASFFSAWFLAHRVKMLEKYHTPIVVGSGIAAAQSLIQLYIPRLGWMVSDATPELDDVASGVTSSTSGDTTTQMLTANGFTASNDDPSDYTFNDEYDAGIFSRGDQAQRQHHQRQQQPPAAAPTAATGSSTDDDLLAELDMQDQGSGGAGGIFNGNLAS